MLSFQYCDGGTFKGLKMAKMRNKIFLFCCNITGFVWCVAFSVPYLLTFYFVLGYYTLIKSQFTYVPYPEVDEKPTKQHGEYANTGRIVAWQQSY
jgi:hypothetical protein